MAESDLFVIRAFLDQGLIDSKAPRWFFKYLVGKFEVRPCPNSYTILTNDGSQQ